MNRFENQTAVITGVEPEGKWDHNGISGFG